MTPNCRDETHIKALNKYSHKMLRLLRVTYIITCHSGIPREDEDLMKTIDLVVVKGIKMILGCPGEILEA